jgi:hypothetical protein
VKLYIVKVRGFSPIGRQGHLACEGTTAAYNISSDRYDHTAIHYSPVIWGGKTYDRCLSATVAVGPRCHPANAEVETSHLLLRQLHASR